MGLMFGTDELWLFFQNNIKKIHHVFLHPSSCWSRFCTDKLGTKALNLRKNILSSQELLTWLLLHWNCHELSAETLHMIKTFQKRQKIQQLDHSIGSHHLCCVFSLRPAPPPQPPNQPINSDDCWNLGDWPLLFYILRRFNCGRGFCENPMISCVMYGSCGYLSAFFIRTTLANFVVHIQSLHMSSLYIHLWLIYFFHGSWWDEPINKSTVSHLNLYEVATETSLAM